MLIVGLNVKKPMQINFVNKESCKMFGYSHKELIGMKINKLMP